MLPVRRSDCCPTLIVDCNNRLWTGTAIVAGSKNRTAITAGIFRVVNCIKDALFPNRCIACRRLFHHAAGSLAGGPTTGTHLMAAPKTIGPHFCPDCRERWTPVASPFCLRCGMMFQSREGDDHMCGQCLERPGAFSKARAVGIYDQSLKIAVHTLKYKGQVGLSKPLGDILLHAYRRFWAVDDIDIVAPVPLHRRRFRARGFNQAYVLIRHWALPNGTEIVRDLIVRSRPTAPQTGLDRKQRQRNIKNAFSIRHPGLTKGKRILLVDDVLTTGATVDACARTLIKDGARQVDVLTLARAM